MANEIIAGSGVLKKKTLVILNELRINGNAKSRPLFSMFSRIG